MGRGITTAGMGLGLAGGLAACGEPPTPSTPVVGAPAEGAASEGMWSHAIRFEGDVVIDRIVTPDTAEPGAPLTIAWHATGAVDGLTVQVRAWPPRAGARQVARGGVGAPPVEVPLDPRVQTETVALVEGPQSLTLTLPSPWNPPQAMITMALLDGDTPIPATDGPRRDDGLAQLALVDVPVRPTAIVAVPMPAAPTLDGRLDEAGWDAAQPHPMVHSLDGEPYLDRPSTVRLAWDATALYVGAEIDDPDVWSQYQRHDDPLWNQEVFEVFVFGDDRREGYLELQVSPRGTTFDARFERYRKGIFAWDGTWQAAVDLRGTLDDRRDRDEGWSAELAIPWEEICAHTEVTCPVRAGLTLRINAFRFERPQQGPTVGLAVSPPRVPDFHAPENAAVLELGGS